MPRNFDAGLKAHYALGTTHVVQCWRATLVDGTVIASTTHTSDLLVDGTLYLSAQGYNHSDVESAADLSVDNMDVDGFLASPLITRDDVHSGRWDYASIVLFEVNPDDVSLGINILRYGTLGQVKAGRSIFTAELRGLTQKYSRRIVTLTTQECQADLGDARCKVDLNDWTVFSTVQSVQNNNKTIVDSARTEAANWFAGGLLTFTTGRNAGWASEVKDYSVGLITLWEAPPFPIIAVDSDPGKLEPPAPPDEYKVYAGCLKRFYNDCIGKFNNGLNFRGFPHLPGVGVFGAYGTAMIPATVPGSYTHSPPPPPLPGGSPGVPPAPGGSFQNKVLATYFETYRDSDPLRITDVPLDFNVIYIFNGKFNGDGSVNFVSATTNASNVQQVRNRGQKCIITFGGSDSKFVFTNRTQSQNFLNSAQAVIAALGGVDGVDFNNYEGSTQPPGEMIWIAQQLKAIYGPNFAITSPAGGNYSQDFSHPDCVLIKAMNDAGVLTWVNPQFYDWSGYKPAGYVAARTLEWITLVGNDASKVVMGLSANYDGFPGSGPYENALTLAECVREYDAVEAAAPNIRGAFCWNAYTDIVVGGNQWGSTMRTHIGSDIAAPPPPAPPPPPADSVDAATYGVVGDGSTDNTAAINTAVAAAKAAGKALSFGTGTFNYSDNIHLDGVRVFGVGTGTVLHATDWAKTAWFLEGSGAGMQNLKMTAAPAPSRQAPYEMCRIVPYGASNWTIDGVFIEGSSAAGIQTGNGAHHGTIKNCTVRNTLSDSIHMNGFVHDIEVAYNLVENSGDDGIACVSYLTDAGRNYNINAHHNTVRNNVFGRGMSVVGGSNVTYSNNLIQNSGQYAGLYIAQENAGSLTTMGNQTVKAEYNTIQNCGSSTTGHAAAMIFSDGTQDNDDIWLLRNDIVQSGSQTGIRYYGPQTRIRLEQNRISGIPSGQWYIGGSDPDVTTTAYSSGAVGQQAAASPPPPAAPPPPPTGGWGTDAAIPLVSPVPARWLQTGPSSVAYWAEDNPWGAGAFTRGTYTNENGSTFESAYGVKPAPYGTNGEVAGRFAWKYPKGDLVNNEVKAYPSLISGKKPGIFSTGPNPDGQAILLPDGTYSGTSPSGATPGTFLALPANGRMNPVNCSFAWHHNVTPTGQGHLSFDLWLQDRSNQTSGFSVPPITHEIMIPLDYWGGYGAYPNGRNPDMYSHDVTIQGVLWHVYMARNFSMGWTFIVFEPDAPLGASGRTLNLAEFLNHITTRTDANGQRWANGTEWLSSIELGVEPVWGIGDVSLTNFRTWQG